MYNYTTLAYKSVCIHVQVNNRALKASIYIWLDPHFTLFNSCFCEHVICWDKQKKLTHFCDANYWQDKKCFFWMISNGMINKIVIIKKKKTGQSVW